MDERQIEADVARIEIDWQHQMSRWAEASADLARISDAIDDVKAEIADLIEAKRDAADEDRQALREEIQYAIERKSDLIAEAREKRSEMAGIRANVRHLRSEANNLSSGLQAELKRLSKGAERIRSSSPASVSFGISGVWSAVESGHRFCIQMLQNLDAVFERGRANSSDDLVFVADGAVDGAAGVLGGIIDVVAGLVGKGVDATAGLVGVAIDATTEITDKTVDTGLLLTEPPLREMYLTLDERRTVPFESYSVFDTLAIPGRSVVEIGEAAVEYAAALLKGLGHASVTAIGGPGLPDILSLDRDRRLWVSEVKGTQSFRTPASGLARVLASQDKGGNRIQERLMENSPAWLSRSSGSVNRVSQVLAAIDRAMVAENASSRREDLRALREAYREAAKSGFNPLVCERQLVQVGFHQSGDVLKPPSAIKSAAFDEWVKVVEPAKIVQIDVIPDAPNAPSVGNTSVEPGRGVGGSAPSSGS